MKFKLNLIGHIQKFGATNKVTRYNKIEKTLECGIKIRENIASEISRLMSRNFMWIVLNQ